MAFWNRYFGAANRSPVAFVADPQPVALRIQPLMRRVEVGRVQLNNQVRNLAGRIPKYESKGTRIMFGDQTPLVFVILRDNGGVTRPGIVIQLLDNGGVLVDETRTDANGRALLKFPKRRTRLDAHGRPNAPAVNGTIQLADGSDQLQVQIPAYPRHHALYRYQVNALPAVPANATPAQLQELIRPGNPLDRLPSDFATDVCDTLTAIMPTTTDPILGGIGGASDFRAQRTALIKRLDIPRVLIPAGGGAPRRFIVRVAQKWNFLGYSLGELANVEAMDPGVSMRELTSTVQQLNRLSERSGATLLDSMESSLTRLSSIDTLLDVASSITSTVKTKSKGTGWILRLFWEWNKNKVNTSVVAETRTASTMNSSYEANSRVHAARSLVNQAIRVLSNVVRQQQIGVSRVSPLLNRVTNLVHWTLYENYAVCSFVEDVHEIADYQFATLPDGAGVYFADEDIVEYQPVFEPALLDPTLAGQFNVLRAAIAERIAGGRPVSSVRIAVDYEASQMSANLRLNIGAAETNVVLAPGDSRVYAIINFAPVIPADLADLEILITRTRVHLPNGLLSGLSELLSSANVTVKRIEVWFNASAGSQPGQPFEYTDQIRTTFSSSTPVRREDLDPPVTSIDTSKNPLFRHINRNHTYYMGLLAQAALEQPSLRSDAPQLAPFPYDDELWRLPIYGFEGDRVLIIQDVDPANDPDVQNMLDQDAGAGTIVQIATPGAYGEALRGVLSVLKVDPAILADETQLLHPELLSEVAAAAAAAGAGDIVGGAAP